MKYTKISADTFKHIQLNAGVLLSEYTPGSTIVDDNIIGATSGGVNFTATPTFIDFGDDVDNCPKNMKELKKLDTWEAKMTGSFVTVSTATAKALIGAADIDSSDATKVTPRNDLDIDNDFNTVWWVGDYSEYNGASNGGYVAIKLINALSTGGFQIQSTDKEKGKFAFEYTAHYSMDDVDAVPFEIYIKEGTAEA